MLLPGRDVRTLPVRLASLVEVRLTRLSVDVRAISAEKSAMMPVEIWPISDRSVLGIMVDFAKSVPHYLEAGYWSESTLEFVEDRLAETPCHATRSFEQVIFPKQKARELLTAKWLPNPPLQPTAENRSG